MQRLQDPPSVFYHLEIGFQLLATASAKIRIIILFANRTILEGINISFQ